jgi:hypothetical protein
MKTAVMAGLMGALVLAMAPLANAANKMREVKFKPGTSFATLKGTVRGYDQQIYLLDALAGQAISVLFSPSRASCTFNFFEPGAASAVHRGYIHGNEYAATLRRSGKNRVTIGMNRNAARKGLTCSYSITFEIN